MSAVTAADTAVGPVQPRPGTAAAVPVRVAQVLGSGMMAPSTPGTASIDQE